jgi:alkanesulfonate monooxygenase SsuD/methylene tetrahydromethanopterin reductase-like flavin-dependent oxidoreductase (luciferase family)
MRKQLHKARPPGQKGYRQMSYEQLKESGLIIAGTPDQVARRLQRFYEQCGCGNILMMMHAGPMSSTRVKASMRRFAEDVMPQVAHLGEDKLAAE